MDYKENIRKNLRLYRQKAGLNQTELAKMLGVSKAAVSNWEKGVNGIDTETLFKIAEILNVSVSKLGGIDSEQIQMDPDTKELVSILEYLSPENKKDLLLFARFIQEKRLVEYAKILGQLRNEQSKKEIADETN